jgi:hypothetical protein
MSSEDELKTVIKDLLITGLCTSVMCGVCKKLYLDCSDKYVSVHGDIRKGLSGDLVGHNLGGDDRRTVMSVSIFCKRCLADIITGDGEQKGTIPKVDGISF